MSIQNIQKMPLLAAVFIYLFFSPYFAWPFQQAAGGAWIFMTGLLCVIFYTQLDIKTNGRQLLFILLFLSLAFTAYMKGNNLVGLTASVMTCVLPFSKEKFARTTFDYFVTIYALLITLSAVMFILALIGVAPRLGTIEPLNELKNYNYTHYPFLVVANDSRSVIPRFGGPFDEPGVVGTISALILTICKFNLKDKRLFAIFITGFISLSFFYYIVVFIYYLIYYVAVAKKNRNSLIIILLFAAFVILTYNNLILHEVLWGRFEWDAQAGQFVGDNRMGDAGTEFFLSTVGTKEFYFGLKDYEGFAEMVSGSASFISAIMHYGAVFSGVFVYLFAAYGWKYKKELIPYLLFLFVFLGTIYQRPFIFDPSYMYLFSMMALTCGDRLGKQVNQLV